MSRLTHKHKYKENSNRYVFDVENYRKVCQKLGQLEDIEDELGIDLITLFKASKGFYSGILDCYCPHPNPIYKTCGERGVWVIDFMDCWHILKDYGKTWALTKEELKNEKEN